MAHWGTWVLIWWLSSGVNVGMITAVIPRPPGRTMTILGTVAHRPIDVSLPAIFPTGPGGRFQPQEIPWRLHSRAEQLITPCNYHP